MTYRRRRGWLWNALFLYAMVVVLLVGYVATQNGTLLWLAGLQLWQMGMYYTWWRMDEVQMWTS